jgi:hypothetical protein
MNLRAGRSLFLLGLTALAAQGAFAEVDPNSQSQANSKTLYERVAEKGILNYFGVYRGAGLNDPGNGFTPLPDGTLDASSPQSIENVVTAGYKFNKDTSLAILAHFYYYPGPKPANTSSGFQNLDPIIQFEQKNLINSNGLKLTGRLWFEIPVSSYDRPLPANNLTAITTTGILSYDVGKTGLTVGLWGYLRGYIASASTPDTARSYKIYLAPNVNYQFSKKVAATLWVDLIQATRNGNTGFISGMTNDNMDVQPGINWDITKNISLNPYFNIYPGNLTLKATSFQANLSARAF